MSTDTILRQAVRGALALGTAGSLVGAGAALAQTAAPAPSTATNLSKIVVTGSHIPRTEIATSQPVINLSRQQIESTGFTTVGQLMRNLPQVGPSLGVQTTNNVGASAGSEFINLHYLGAQRLLVLINGQRMANSLSGAVDISTIPLSIIQRVEVDLDGASPIYGSGAIAGVVNFITIKNYNGAEAAAYMGIYDATNDGGGWDGRTQQYHVTIGTSGDRSGVLFSAGYYQADPISKANRYYSAEPFYGFKGGLLGSSSVPQGNFIFDAPPGLLPPGYAAGCTPTPNAGKGNTHCHLAGPLNGPNGNPHPYGAADNYNYAPVGDLTVGQEKWYAYTQGHYDLTPNITFNTSVLYERRISRTSSAAAPLIFGADTNTDFPTPGSIPIGVAGNNPFNPFSAYAGHPVDLVPFVPASATSGNAKYVAWCNAYGGAPGGGCTADKVYLQHLGIRDIAHGGRTAEIRQSMFRYTGGFQGYFMLAGNQWTWNAGYDYESLDATQISNNLYNTGRLLRSLGNVNGCTSPCVPYDVFDGQNHSAQNNAQAAYTQYDAYTNDETHLREYRLNVAGNFFNGWYAGPWGVAFGYQYDDYDGSFNPDPLKAQQLSSGNAFQPSNGRIGENAEYAELTIPFGAGVPGFYKFSVDGALRYEQYQTAGSGTVSENGQSVFKNNISNHYAINVGRVGIKWKPIKSLLLRATWSQGFRAPSITELFSASESFSAVIDPCALKSKTSPPPAGFYPPGCARLGVPLPVPANASGQILTTIGGNAKLEPETSISRQVGFVWSPPWAPGLDISADYYKVVIGNTIGRIGPAALLGDCLAAAPSNCDKIVRNPNTGLLTQIVGSTANLGTLRTNGFDVNLKYAFPTTPFGKFTASLTGNIIRDLVSCSASGKVCSDAAGDAGVPKYKYDFRVGWDFGPWAATYSMHIIGQTYSNCFTNVFGINPNSATADLLYNSGKAVGYARNWPRCAKPHANRGIPYGTTIGMDHDGTTIYQDIQGSYTVAAWNTTFTLGVNNLFDKRPPIEWYQNGQNYSVNFATYRFPGRFIYGRVSVQF